MALLNRLGRAGIDLDKVIGHFAGTPALASANTTFDLGPDWASYKQVMVSIAPVGPSTGLSAVGLFWQDDTTPVSTRPAVPMGTTVWTGLSAAITVAAGAQSLIVPVGGRYLRAAVTNADAVNALGGASALTFVAQ